MWGVLRRGALIVLEGCDRCGKTTQCKRLVEALNAEGVKAQLWRFPERDTAIGKVINDYLERRCELEDHAVHLLFSANRWELVPKMKELLMNGTTLVVDRYSYSGVAFSGAKENLDLEWCRKPEMGLPLPDLVLYLSLGAEEAAKRAEFGGERYEQTDFQKTVAENYSTLKEPDWKVIDASKSIDELHTEIKHIANSIIGDVTGPVGRLWMPSEPSQNGHAALQNGHAETVDMPPAKKIRQEADGVSSSSDGTVNGATPHTTKE